MLFSLLPQPPLPSSSPSALSLVPNPLSPSPSQSLLTVHFNHSLPAPPCSVLPGAALPLLHHPGLTPLPETIQGSFKILLHLYPKFKIEYRSSLLFFFGCLYSFGLLPGMGGIDQTRDQDLEDEIASIYFVYIK